MILLRFSSVVVAFSALMWGAALVFPNGAASAIVLVAASRGMADDVDHPKYAS